MTEHIRRSNKEKNFFAEAEEDFEVVSYCDTEFVMTTLDPEEPQAAADISALNDSPDIIASGRNGGMMSKRIIAAASILLIATVVVAIAVVVDITKHPAISKNNSVRKLHNLFEDTSAYTNLFDSNSAIVTKREIDSKAQKDFNDKAQAECCVNVDAATPYCHAKNKCNKKESECEKCNKKSKSDTYRWQTKSDDPPSPSPPTAPSPTPPPPPPPPPPSPTPPAPTPAVACCVHVASNTCHADTKCNEKQKKCKKDKCQKNGYSVWKVPIAQTNAPTNNPTTLSPTSFPTAVPTGSPTQKPSSAAPSKSPTPAPSASPTSSPTQKPVTAAPSNAPTSASPTQKPSSAAPSKSPTSSPSATPSKSPTSAPSASPTSSPTQKPVTTAPTNLPTANPSSAPTAFVDPTVYEYTDTGTSCSIGGGDNVQGPAPLADKRNVVVDFWVYGDTPYDFMVKSCLDGNGNPSTCNKCAVSNGNMDDMPFPNTCTFEGADYECVRDSIIPFMNGKMDGGDGAFQVHLGDILKGIPSGNSRRCTEASFQSRANLFQPAYNFLLINGDNESNECKGYDIEEPSDPIRDMWRSKFGNYIFTRDFPATFGGGKPGVLRMSGNEEIFGFEYENVAFFGLDYPAGDTYITENAPEDLNAKFVRETLASDTGCDLKSIVMFSHIAPKSDVNDELEDYFDRCEVLPTLSVLGNAHPSTYCLTKDSERLSLTVEAFKSGPLFVSVVRDGKDGGGDYFHVADSDLKDSNSDCPDFA